MAATVEIEVVGGSLRARATGMVQDWSVSLGGVVTQSVDGSVSIEVGGNDD